MFYTVIVIAISVRVSYLWKDIEEKKLANEEIGW